MGLFDDKYQKLKISRHCLFKLIYTVKKVCGSWNQKLYIGEYSEIYSLKLKNSGIYNLRFAPS
jgi:hypothetical protein